MKNRLLWKLLLINIIPVIGVVTLITWLAIDHLAANYFMTLMVKYDVSPTDTHAMFLSAIHRYLLWAFGLATALALLISYLLTRKLLRPLTQMAAVADRLAKGDFSTRVDVIAHDEIGQLGTVFNHMADNLAKIEQLRKNLVADVAHELRTPLTNLRGYLEGLSDKVVPATRETFDMLLQEILRLVRLVEDLQQLAKADAAKAVLQRTPLDLIALAKRLIDLFQPNFNEKGITVHTRFDSRSGPVNADRDKLLHAMRNLMENAWKYTSNQGNVFISIEPLGDIVRVEFCNDGPGIASEDLPLIFERFFRADRSRTRNRTNGGTDNTRPDHSGAGIGLAIVKELIEAHGGHVGARSKTDHTCIWFELPADQTTGTSNPSNKQEIQ